MGLMIVLGENYVDMSIKAKVQKLSQSVVDALKSSVFCCLCKFSHWASVKSHIDQQSSWIDIKFIVRSLVSP